MERLRALRAPDPAWATLRDDLAANDARWVALLRDGAPGVVLADLVAAREPLHARWTHLIEGANTAWAARTPPAVRRRGTVTSRLLFGAAGLAIGCSSLLSAARDGLRPTDVTLWLGLICVGLGIAMFAAAAAAAVRR